MAIRWVTIGSIILVYENEDWYVKMQVLFFKKNWQLSKINTGAATKRKRVKKATRPNASHMNRQKIWQLITSFRVTQLDLAISNDNMIINAWLYPLNFLPGTRQHVHINFIDENYLLLTIRNTGWRMLYAWIK